MKLTCPVCESKYDLKQAAITTGLREMVGLAAKFGSFWELVEEYVEAFRQSQYGGISAKKRVRLLKEILRLWEGREFEYHGKRYRTDKAHIRAAMTAVCNADKFGFQNHNYLKKILLKQAERVSAEGLTAKEESKRDELRGAEEKMTAEEYKARHQIETFAGKVGKEMP